MVRTTFITGINVVTKNSNTLKFILKHVRAHFGSFSLNLFFFFSPLEVLKHLV